MSGGALAWPLLTLAAYATALWLYGRSGHHLLCLPVLTGTALVVGALALTGTGYPVYAQATQALRWLAGPAVIALAVPLYRQAAQLRRLALPLLGALSAGCLTAVLSVLALSRLLGAPREVALSLAPKSATMPVAMAAAERAGGIASLAAMAVVATGVIGTLVAVPVLRRLRIDDESVQAFTLGLAAHAIGVARVLQMEPETVAFAALAMSANGLTTAVVVALVARGV
jgi:putative effector of murein hydrolase